MMRIISTSDAHQFFKMDKNEKAKATAALAFFVLVETSSDPYPLRVRTLAQVCDLCLKKRQFATAFPVWKL